jgi:ATP-dependent Clp protease ATP-binding subunit ClpX
MKLGEAVAAAFQHKNVGGRLPAFLPISTIPANEATQTIATRLAALKQTFQEIPSGRFLATCLKWNPAEPEGQDDLILLVVATIVWLRLSGWNPESRINVLTTILSCSLDCPVPEAVVKARFAVHANVDNGVLTVRDENVYLARPIAVCLTEGNASVMRTLMGADERNPFGQGSAPRGENCKDDGEKRFQTFIKNLPVLRPAELDDLIVSSGYVSQEQARRAVCIAASRHVRRLRALHVDGKKADQLPKRDCLLLIGPTGSGKTHLLETVFGKLLNLPVVIFDASQITESANVGAKLDHVLGRLVQNCAGNIRIAECGVIGLDEIDKIAAVGTADGATPGEAISRDVAGSGAQKHLLKLLEGSSLSVIPYGRGDSWIFNAQSTLVVGAGAFTALRHERRQGRPIGFGGAILQSIQTPHTPKIGADDLIRYGFQAEFLGRFSHLVDFGNLTVPDLREILTRNVIPRHRAELDMEGIRLSVEDAVLDHLAEEAEAKGTGARGLQTALSALMQDCLFDALSAENVREVRLVLGRDGIGYEIERRPMPKATTNQPEVEDAIPL